MGTPLVNFCNIIAFWYFYDISEPMEKEFHKFETIGPFFFKNLISAPHVFAYVSKALCAKCYVSSPSPEADSSSEEDILKTSWMWPRPHEVRREFFFCMVM